MIFSIQLNLTGFGKSPGFEQKKPPETYKSNFRRYFIDQED